MSEYRFDSNQSHAVSGCVIHSVIANINKMVSPSDKDLQDLSVNQLSSKQKNQDLFSRLSIKDLLKLGPEMYIVYEDFKKHRMDGPTKKLSEEKIRSALRWVARGLLPNHAVRKVSLIVTQYSKQNEEHRIREARKRKGGAPGKGKKKGESLSSPSSARSVRLDLDAALPDTPPQASLSLAGVDVESFSYLPEHIEAMKSMFTGALNLDAKMTTRSGDPAHFGVCDLPTGIGKSRIVSECMAEACGQRVALAAQSPGTVPEPINFISTTHALAADPRKMVVDNMSRKGLREGSHYSIIDLPGNEVLLFGKDGDRKDPQLPEGCGAESKMDRRAFKDAAVNSFKDALKILDGACFNVWTSSCESSGELPKACRGCRLRNPGGALYHSDLPSPDARFGFLTYKKMMGGLRAVVVVDQKPYVIRYTHDGEPPKYGEGDFHARVKASAAMKQRKFCFPPSAWVLEEAAHGYAVMLEHLMDVGEVDLFGFANHMHLQYDFKPEYLSGVKQLLSETGADAAWSQALTSRLEKAIDKPWAEFLSSSSEFYVQSHRVGQNGDIEDARVYPYGVGENAQKIRCRVSKSEEASVESKFKIATDIAFQSLSSDQGTGYSVDGLNEQNFSSSLNHCTLWMRNRRQDAAVPLQAVSNVIQNIDSRVVRSAARMQLDTESALREIWANEVRMLENAEISHDERDRRKLVIDYSEPILRQSRAAALREWKSSMEIMERLESRRRSAATKNRTKGASNFLSSAERLRMVGYSVAEIRYQQEPADYTAMLHVTEAFPESVLINLIESGSRAVLVSATVSYPSPISTFNLGFLSERGYHASRPSPEVEATLRGMIESKYLSRLPLQLRPFVGVFKNKGGENWQLFKDAKIAGDVRLFAEVAYDFGMAIEGRMHVSRGDEGASSGRKDHPASALVHFAASVTQEPRRPRAVIALTNSKAEAEALKKMLKERGGIGDKLIEVLRERHGVNLTIDAEVYTSDAIKDGTVNHSLFQKQQKQFVEKLTKSGPDDIPISVIIAAKNSLGVGANLDFEVTSDQIAGGIPCQLKAFLNHDKPIRFFEGAKSAHFDVSDFILCMSLTHVVGEELIVPTLMALYAEGHIDPALLKNRLSWGMKDAIPFFRKAPFYHVEVMMLLTQYIGRLDRALNNASGQCVWIPEAEADFLAGMPDLLREDGQPVTQTPSLAGLLSQVQYNELMGREIFSAAPTSADIYSIVGPMMNESLSAIHLWESLRALGVKHQAEFLTEFASSQEAQAIKDTLRLAKEENPGITLNRISDLYLRVPARSLVWPIATRSSSELYDGYAGGQVLLLSAFVAEDLEKIYIAPRKSGIPQNLRSQAVKLTWRLYNEKIAKEYTQYQKGKNPGFFDAIPKEIDVLRPAMLRDVGTPAVDEKRTELAFRKISGVHVGKMPNGAYEKAGDHYLRQPAVLVDNKSLSYESSLKNYYFKDGGLAQLVEKGRRKLALAAPHMREAGLPVPRCMVYLMRNPVEPKMREEMEKSKRPQFIKIGRGGSTIVEGERVDFDVIICCMPEIWDSGHLEELCSVLHARANAFPDPVLSMEDACIAPQSLATTKE